MLSKTDVKSAYRIVPIHPDDRQLLGMRWQGMDYIDTALPFGLRSAPKIFTALADAIQWVASKKGVQYIQHYLDDFITAGAPQSDECGRNLQMVLETCGELGVPIADDKTEGPATCITFLGIEMDTIAMVLRLPPYKLQRLQQEIQQWCQRKFCTKKELQSLAGSLQHACKVVRPGRPFTRRIYEQLAQREDDPDHYHIRLCKSTQADIEWWRTFLPTWNGVSMLRDYGEEAPHAEVWSDASGVWGCGAFWQCHWFQIQWGAGQMASASIAAKELFPIVVACVVWGHMWQGCTVRCISDNEAAVQVINQRYAKDALLMHMIRCLFFVCAKFDVNLVAKHTPGKDNVLADALSRGNLPFFLSQVPHACTSPTPIPFPLVLGLSMAQPEWTSPDWTRWFSSILQMV
jgi:hypothetical protein